MIDSVILPINLIDFKTKKEVDDIKTIFQFEKQIGKGAFGEVFQATRINGSQEVAIKIVEKQRFQENKNLEELIQNETKILQEHTNPNLM